MTSLVNELALLVKKAAEIREESGLSGDVNAHGDYQYNIPLDIACKTACHQLSLKSELWFPVYLILGYTWNDILHWADNPKAYK